MSVDKKILEEITRFNSINRYINEQELPPPPVEDPLADPAAAGAPPVDPLADPAAAAVPPVDPAAVPPVPESPTGDIPQPVDIENDPDVEKVGEGDSNTQELDVTELVKSQKNVEEKQEEYFQQLFSHLENLENKLGEMDSIVNQLNSLEAKVEKYRNKSPEEKLKLRTLDSGPFDQTLSQYFEDKEDDFEKLGRDEYILTKDEVSDFSPKEIQKTFTDYDKDGEQDNVFKVKY
jgi:hypothetical protein